MTRSMVAVSLFLLGFLAGAPAPASGQTSLLGRQAPEIAGSPWLNSQPLTLMGLRGRVVLVDFWTSG